MDNVSYITVMDTKDEWHEFWVTPDNEAEVMSFLKSKSVFVEA